MTINVVKFQEDTRIGRSFLSAVSGRFASIGGYTCKKQLDPFWQKSNVLRKKGKFNFKIVGLGYAHVFIVHSPNMHNSVDENGNYYEYSPEPRR
jgi:hypothetical protein